MKKKFGTSSFITLLVFSISVTSIIAQSSRGKLRESVLAAPEGITQKPNVDMDGDGRSDFVVTRPTGGFAAIDDSGKSYSSLSWRDKRKHRTSKRVASASAAAGGSQIVWWVLSSSTGQYYAETWGDADIDTPISADFDGDDTDDLAVWRSNIWEVDTGFYWIDSSTSTFHFDLFGLPTDDPTVVADFDGDGTDDRATFRCPLSGPGQCHFYYKPSSNPSSSFVTLPWGYGTYQTLIPCNADYDGDQRSDICIYREIPESPGQWQYVYLPTTSTTGERYVNWGVEFDFLVPGDYDADGRSDFALSRVDGDILRFYVLSPNGNILINGLHWGVSSDIEAPGDYDGDGRQDVAVWRADTGTFWVRHTGNGSIRGERWGWGDAGDVPLANWYVR